MSNIDENVEGEKEPTTRVEAIRRAIKLFESKLGDKSTKVTAGDYIRLLDILEDLEGEKPKEIRVRWVEQDETESSTTDE